MTAAIFVWWFVQIWSAPASSLGEAAVREAIRRASVPASDRVLTNDDLEPAPATPAIRGAAAVVAPPEILPEPSGSKGPEKSAKPEVRDEAWWRSRMADARATLARNQLLRDALQSRIAALDRDIANWDDPIQRGKLADDRRQAADELERLLKQGELDAKAITDIQDDARKAGVPAGWVR